MEFIRRFLVVLCVATCCVSIVSARSILQGSLDVLLNNAPENDESSSLSESVSGYRHRLEHSTDLQAIRWSLRKLNADELCEFCDLIVTVVSYLLRFFVLNAVL